MNQFEIGVQEYENLQNLSKDIPNSAWCSIFLGYKEDYGIYRFELPKKQVTKKFSSSSQIIWEWHGDVLDQYTQIFQYIVNIFIILNINFRLVLWLT